MLGITNFWAFVFAGILLNLTPGSDTMYILGRSLAGGVRAGVVSALGITTGSILHTLLAALGLSVILAESAVAFTLVKFVGAAYLTYLGVRYFLKGNGIETGAKHSSASSRRVYLSGVLTNLFNPKVALFFLAFLPQFIDIESKHSFYSFIILGLTFTLTNAIWCTLLALFSATFSKRLRSSTGLQTWLNRVTGMVFILLGVRLFLSRR